MVFLRLIFLLSLRLRSENNPVGLSVVTERSRSDSKPIFEIIAMMSKEKASSLHRQWLILQHLPQGKWLGTADIQAMLERAGVMVSLRTIQRDLNQLAEPSKVMAQVLKVGVGVPMLKYRACHISTPAKQ